MLRQLNLSPNMTSVYRVCPNCGTLQRVECDADGYEKWCNGEGLIQDMLPELDPEEREVLISGICPECWNNIFPE